MQMTTPSETQGLVEQFDPEALAFAVAAPEDESPEAPVQRSSRKTLLTVAVGAVAINGAGAIYAWPADLRSLSADVLGDLLLRRDASAPKADPVVAPLKD